MLQLWRYFTYHLLHTGEIHLIFNIMIQVSNILILKLILKNRMKNYHFMLIKNHVLEIDVL